MAPNIHNQLMTVDIPKMVNDLRPIVWSERHASGTALSITIQLRFGSIAKPQLTENQILQPIQAQQLSKSYNGRLLVNIEITIRKTDAGEAMREDRGCPPSVGRHLRRLPRGHTESQHR